MADYPLVTIQGAVQQATTIGLSIADPDATPTPTTAKLRLFKTSLGVPSVDTPITEFEANEADYTGYPAGGFVITTMAPPMGMTGGGVIIMSNEVFATYTSGDANEIGGYWLEDSAGNMITSFVYDPARTLANVPDGWPVIATLGFGRNSV